ncbi:hypothetical protein [Providencia sp.]|uniref:hypothetical protein n=1 Tax=Providencia sp. TaxID=589 RepID=UPI0025DE3110|nr:hypothetical protein [Providencia sp.]
MTLFYRNSAKIKKRIKQSTLCLLLIASGNVAYAAGAECTPNGGHMWNPVPEINIDMNTTLGEISAGTELGKGYTGFFHGIVIFQGLMQIELFIFIIKHPQQRKLFYYRVVLDFIKIFIVMKLSRLQQIIHQS